jgi:two-component system, cell cycle sensor histidine kinase and response regulator CckA
MSVTTLLLLSIVFQVGATVFALRLIGLTGRRSPWVLLAAAMGLMAVRRGVTLWSVLRGSAVPAFEAEVLSLGISVLLLAGTALIGSVFQRAGRALRLVEDAERRYSSLLANVLDIVARLGRTGAIEYVSPAVRTVLGLEPRAVVGRSGFDLVHPEDVEYVTRLFNERVGVPGPAAAVSVRVRHADGSWRLLEISANNQLDDSTVGAIILTARDVTEQEATRRALGESRERLELVVNHASDGIFLADTDGRWLDVNPAACELLGYGREELIGKHVTEMIAPEDLEQQPLRLDDLRGEQTVIVRRALVRRDGTRVRVEASLRLLPDGRIIAVARDLSERERTTAAIEASERRFRRMVEHGWDVILLVDAAGVMRYLTPSVERVLGHSVADTVNRSVFDFIHPDDHATAAARLAEILRSPDRGVPVEVRARHRDGSWRWVEATGINLLDDPSVQAIVATYRDITERKRAAEELETRARQQAAVAELGRVALEAADLRHLEERAVELAAATLDVEFAKILTYDPEADVLRLTAGVGWRPGTVGTATVPADAGSQGGYTLRVRAPVVVTDFAQERRFCAPPLLRDHGIRSGLSVVVGPSEHPHGVLGVHSSAVRAFTSEDARFVQTLADVLAAARDRLTVEDRLRTSEVNYRALVDHVSYGLYRSTPDGRLLMANPALAEMLGYGTVGELLATGMTQVYAIPGQRAELMHRYADADRIERVEVDWVRKDGRPIRVQLTGRQVRNATGETEAFEMIVEDVTERRTLERQLRASQKMEAVGQLTGGIAHDFNNILTTVLANADILASSLPAHLAELRRDVEDVKAAATRGAELIRKLMAFSRREPLALEHLDLATVASEASGMLRRLLPESIEMRLTAEPAADRVRADRGAILQIILNLATNARDAMPEGGLLHVATFPVTLDDQQCLGWGFGRPGRFMCLELRDSGVGMDESTRARVFEPFFTTKPVGKGTGLGLAMVYGLVKQHHGYVVVDSKVGGGSRFRVYFPVGEAEGAPEAGVGATPAKGGVRGGAELLLLVEDEESIRRSASRVLEQFGYRVLTAADGLEALGLLESSGEKVDLVIADVVMPRLTGRKLYEAVSRMPHRPRFLFTSGYAQGEMPWEERVAPGVPFLPKPWLVTELLARVRETLDGPVPDWPS